MEEYVLEKTYIDSIGFRINCKEQQIRKIIFDDLVEYLVRTKMVSITYNKKRSNQYYQITNLQCGNTTIATIAKGYYTKQIDLNKKLEFYYININLYGLKRYDKKIDDKSELLLLSISDYLNNHNIHFDFTELDICIDIESSIDNIQAVCINRTPNVQYHDIGNLNTSGNKIQKYKNTYYIEQYKDNKKKKNAICRAYLYNKRSKEININKRDIGMDITRFELKFQSRFFAKNELSVTPFVKNFGRYALLYFKDTSLMLDYQTKMNNTTNSKQRQKIVDSIVKYQEIILIHPRMDMVFNLLKKIKPELNKF